MIRGKQDEDAVLQAIRTVSESSDGFRSFTPLKGLRSTVDARIKLMDRVVLPHGVRRSYQVCLSLH